MKHLLVALFAFFALTVSASPKQYSVMSPDGNLKVTVMVENDGLYYSLEAQDKEVVAKSRIEMSLDNGTLRWGPGASFKATRCSKDETVVSPTYRCKQFRSKYNELKLQGSEFGLQFRVFDEGAAWRFFTENDGDHIVDGETAEFNFSDDLSAYIPFHRNFPENYGFETEYSHIDISKAGDTVIMMPMVVELENGHKLLLTESDLFSYPGMSLRKNGDHNLVSVFPTYPLEEGVYTNDKWNRYVTRRAPYIAKVSGNRTFPWRIMAYAKKDTDLPVNNLVYALARENRVGDVSWVRPGKSAWDWWSDWGIYGVDFKVGVNTETYRYYVDFAKAKGLEYIILDEGWNEHAKQNLLISKPEVDVPAIVEYAKSKGIGVILWVVSQSLNDNAEEVCKYYSEMGVVGFKIDFTDRADQLAVEMIENISAVTAKYHLMADYHGIYKPTGLNRTYPNVVNFEGVYGLEQLKWSTNTDMPRNDVLIPYLRMVAGPIDYTQGAMLNAAKGRFKPINSAPMSQGTRAHQVALYAVFDSPLVMLTDTPTNYLKDSVTTAYIARFAMDPERTEILQGEMEKYIVTAREKDGIWYVGGITSWQPRDVKLSLDFLAEGKTYRADIFKDGVNADRIGVDYATESVDVTSSDNLDFHMAPGGGFAVIFTEVR